MKNIYVCVSLALLVFLAGEATAQNLSSNKKNSNDNFVLECDAPTAASDKDCPSSIDAEPKASTATSAAVASTADSAKTSAKLNAEKKACDEAKKQVKMPDCPSDNGCTNNGENISCTYKVDKQESGERTQSDVETWRTACLEANADAADPMSRCQRMIDQLEKPYWARATVTATTKGRRYCTKNAASRPASRPTTCVISGIPVGGGNIEIEFPGQATEAIPSTTTPEFANGANSFEYSTTTEH